MSSPPASASTLRFVWSRARAARAHRYLLAWFATTSLARTGTVVSGFEVRAGRLSVPSLVAS